VTASSEASWTGQLAVKAVDGVADGYPGDYSHEWATAGGGVGSWLQLAWGGSQVLDHVILHDRPNLDDQVTGGTLTFSDGSSVSVGALPNDGSGLQVSFSPRATTSLRFTVTAARSSTINVGLSELEAWRSGA
jgi:hypothetical protein